MNSIGGLSNKGFSEMVGMVRYSEVVQWFTIRRVVQVCKIFRGLSDIRGCSMGFKNKKLLFLN